MSERQLLRCARCGIESRERACFIFPDHSTSSGDLRCISCEQRPLKQARLRLTPGIRFLAGLLWPVPVLWVLHPEYLQPILMNGLMTGLTIAALLVILVPAAIIAHELGHALAAWLLGMEVGMVEIGNGRETARFELGAITIRLCRWPVSGGVYIGAPTLHRLRTRAWLVTLMGPVTNGAMAVLTLLSWQRLESWVSPLVLLLWVIVNAVVLYIALRPVRRAGQGRVRASDGLALLKIPFLRHEQLRLYLISALITRAMVSLEREDYECAQRWLLLGLKRIPHEVGLTVTLAGCHLLLGQHERAIALLSPLRHYAPLAPPRQRAAIYHHLALALVMTHAGSAARKAHVEEADRLSAAACAMFPCVLSYRTTRALVLCVKQRAAEALELLDYVHYASAIARQAAEREVVRALAFDALDKAFEAREAARHAVELHPVSRQWLKSLREAAPYAWNSQALPAG